MSSKSAENTPLFDQNEIDGEISKNGIYLKKGNLPEIKTTFKLIKNISQEEIAQKEKNKPYSNIFVK